MRQIKYRDYTLFEMGNVKPPFAYGTSLEERACFFYVIDGEYETLNPFGSVKLGNKEALFKRCGNHLSRYLKTSITTSYTGIVAYFYPEIIKEIFKDEIPYFLKKDQPAKPPMRFSSNVLIDDFVKTLLVYFDNPKLMDDHLAILKLKELILLLFKNDNKLSIRQFFSEIFYPGQLDLLTTVENNLFSSISVNELAFLCNMSISSFKRAFQKQFHQSPARYLKNKKLEKAAQLLILSDNRINEIAFDCGFNNLTTFSSSFRQYFGKSPSQYRQTHTIEKK